MKFSASTGCTDLAVLNEQLSVTVSCEVAVQLVKRVDLVKHSSSEPLRPLLEFKRPDQVEEVTIREQVAEDAVLDLLCRLQGIAHDQVGHFE